MSADTSTRVVEQRAARRRAHDALIRGIQQLFHEAQSSESDEQLGRRCLQIAEEVTGSRYGFIGEIGSDGRVLDLAISDPARDACGIAEPAGHGCGPSGSPLRGLYGRVLADRAGFYTNDPASHPASAGLPAGHPPLTGFLGVPLVQDGKTMGILAVANREGGYREDDLHRLAALAPAVVQTLVRRRSEQRLRDSEARLRTLGDNLPDGAVYRYVHPARGAPSFEYISAGVERICGVSPAEVLRDPAALLDSVIVEDLARLAREEARSRETLEPLEAEVRHRHRQSGQLHWTAVRAVPRRLDGSTVWDGHLFDITERKRNEALTAALNSIHQVIHSTRDFAIIMRVAVSEAVRATGGDSGAVSLRDGDTWRVSEVTGLPESAVGTVTTDDEERHAVLAVRTGAPVAVADTEVDDRVDRDHMRRLGVRAVLAVPITIRDEAVGVLFLNHHEPTTFTPAHLDFAMKLGSAMGLALENARLLSELERELGERRAREERIAVLARLYGVLSRVNEAIVRSRDERTLFAEVCRIVAEEGGFPLVWIGLVRGSEVAPVAANGPGTDYVAGVHIQLEGRFGDGPTGTCVREGRPVVNHNFATNPATGAWRERALSFGFRSSAAFPLRRQGDLVGSLTLYSAEPEAFDPEHVRLLDSLSADLSYALGALAEERLRSETEAALRVSEQSLREADHRKNEFLAVLSHELRNPLAPIVNGLYVLGHAAPGSEPAARALAVIDRQVKQLSTLVNDLLDVTRITRNKIHLQRERLDLRDVVRRAVDDNRSLFDESRVRIELALPEDPLPVHADPTRLAQIVGNLLHNAAKFTAPGGHTSVSVRVEQDEAIVTVADDGVGMSSETIARLFQPFVQADATLDRSKGGLGLGLALVRGLVELHGGRIAVHSAGLGKGSQVFVRLPLDRGPARHEGTEHASAAPRRRVLIVEDNVDAAETLREALEMCGHEVAVAHDGVQGLSMARSQHPEVVLCDIGLPGMDGYAVARAIRADEGLRDVALVALSGYALADDLRRARQAGFDRHLAKPPSIEQLKHMLATIGK